MSFIVYGKESCPHCVNAVELLKANDIAFTYKKMEVDYTKEELLEILAPFNVIPRTVPQIVFDNDGELEYIGGFTELRNTLKKSVDTTKNTA